MTHTPEKKFVRLSYGNIAYLETGSSAKPPVLFIHGIPTSGYLWRHVIRFLQNDLHCYAPDLMGLGDTDVDPRSGAFHMDAQAEMLGEFMAAMGHDQFAVVCHDQGGAAAQILAAQQPHRLSCLVLTNCVCYDNWPVPAIVRMQHMYRLPRVAKLLGRVGFVTWLETRRRLSQMGRGVFRRDSLSDDAVREYLRPLRMGPKERERFRRFFLAGHPRYTELIVDDLKTFEKPTLILWAADDHYLSPSWGRKLLDDIPGAQRLELIPFCGHFWPEERPSEFASYIGEFISIQVAAAKKLASGTLAEESATPSQPAKTTPVEKPKAAVTTKAPAANADGAKKAKTRSKTAAKRKHTKVDAAAGGEGSTLVADRS